MHLRQRAYRFEILVEPELGYKVKCTASSGMWRRIVWWMFTDVSNGCTHASSDISSPKSLIIGHRKPAISLSHTHTYRVATALTPCVCGNFCLFCSQASLNWLSSTLYLDVCYSRRSIRHRRTQNKLWNVQFRRLLFVQFNYLENNKIKCKCILGIKCVSHFSLRLLYENFFSPINIQQATREMLTKPYLVLYVNCPVLLFYFNQTPCRHILVKLPNIKFHENSFSHSRVRTDEQIA